VKIAREKADNIQLNKKVRNNLYWNFEFKYYNIFKPNSILYIF
jgi:hypothetical protein